jgi:hypothetical protein
MAYISLLLLGVAPSTATMETFKRESMKRAASRR